MTVSKKLIENVEELRKALNEISVYDFDVYTSMELYYKIANKLNEVIKELMRFEGLVSDEVVEQNEKLIYLLGEGLNIEVVKKINQMVQDGTMDSIINHNVFNSLNNKIDEYKEELSSQIKDKANIDEINKFQKIIRYTDGIFDSGAVLGVIANKEDTAKIQVCGFNESSETSKYTDRDSVALYTSNTGTNPTITAETASYGYNYVDLPTTIDLSKVKEGMVIDTKHTPNAFSSIVESVNGNRIYVKTGWYKQISGGSTDSAIPANNVGLYINKVTKIWGRNTNIFLNENTSTRKMVGEELGLFDQTDKTTQTTVWGYDLVNFGNKDSDVGFQARQGKNGFKSAFRSTLRGDDGNYLIDSYFGDNREFGIKNSGELSKLKLKARTYSDGVIQQTADKETNMIFLSKTIDEVFNIKPPVNCNGEVVMIINVGSLNQLISTNDNSDIYCFGEIVKGFRIPPFGSVQMVSTGANWVVFGGQVYGKGYITQNQGGNIKKDLSINGTLSVSKEITTSSTLTTNGTIISATGNIVCTSENGSLKTASSAWNKGHLQLGGYHIWVDDSGNLRIKGSAPTSATDGRLVGI